MDKSVPFWFLNASLLQLESYTLPAHQKLTLRYRVLIHPRRWDAARLQEEHARYVRDARKDWVGGSLVRNSSGVNGLIADKRHALAVRRP